MSIQLELPLPIQTPLIEKQPPARLMPYANVEVASDDEYSALAKVVDAAVMEKSVEVALNESVEVPIAKMPAVFDKRKCLESVPPFMSVRASCGLNVTDALVEAS